MKKWRKERSQILKDEPFMTVVYSGDLEKIKEMVEKGANVNARNSAGCTALMLAGNIGRPDIMEYLNQKGAQIETKTSDNYLAVSVPIRHAYMDVIQFYIKHGVALNALGLFNETALHLAVQAHRDGLAPDFTPEKKRQMLELLLRSGASDCLNLEDDAGLTPLMTAIARNDIDTCKWLIEAGSDISLKNKKGQDALAIAKHYNRQVMVEILQNELSNKPVQSSDSNELLMKQLLEKITPIIENNIKQQVEQEMKQLGSTIPANQKEPLKEKRAEYFIESFSGTAHINSEDSTPSVEASLH